MNVADATGAASAGAISSASPSQVNFLIPAGLSRGHALMHARARRRRSGRRADHLGRVAPGLFSASQILRNDAGKPHLVLYGTGIRNRSAIEVVICIVNGASLPVAYAGAQADFAGLDQVNVPLPADLRPGNTLNVCP